MKTFNHSIRIGRLQRWRVALAWLAGSAVISLRAANPEPANWFAGDPHVHRSCGGSPVSVASIYSTMVVSNLAVVSLLADMGNGEVQDPTTDLPLVNGQDASVSATNRLLHWDAEWHWDATYDQYAHQALGGHVVLLGLTNAYQMWSEYTYPIFQFAHRQGGIAGFCHLHYLDDDFPQFLSCCTPIEYPVEVALGSCDFIAEDVTGGDSAIHAYYRLLNCGLRPGFAGGSDYPCGSNIGQTLTYVQIPSGPLTYRNWIQGIAAGRTVVSRTGHSEFLNLKVNDAAGPGDEIQLTNAGTVSVTAQWSATAKLSGAIELVKNGVVVGSLAANVTASSPATFSANIAFTNSGWLCARRMNNGEHALHTAAVFVTVNHAPVRASVDDAQFYVQWMDNLLALTSPGGAWSSYFVTNRAQAQARYTAARTVYQQIAQEAAALLPLTISSTTLPYGTVNTPYTATLTASNGATPYTWSIANGSLPSGLTLNANSGVIAGIPTNSGIFKFAVQTSDSGNPVQIINVPLSIAVIVLPESFSLWAANAVPMQADAGSDRPVELGVKFRSDIAGFVTGVRFYKAAANTGTHVGNLWNTKKTHLATVVFSNESGVGWQQAVFPQPVAISSNTIYIASYHCGNGHYSEDEGYFAVTGVDNPPLNVPSDDVSGGNGVYAYSGSSVYPSKTYQSANYWVDVVFSATANIAPVLPPQNNHTITENATLLVTNTALDFNLDNLSYRLQAAGTAPVTNASISADGIIRWTPTTGQSGSSNEFVTVVTDDGQPPLSATNTFAVLVNSNSIWLVPVIQSLAVSNAVAVVTWSAVSNRIYRLQYIDDLADTNWVDVPTDLPAIGPVISATNFTGSAPQRFYRVVLQPAP